MAELFGRRPLLARAGQPAHWCYAIGFLVERITGGGVLIATGAALAVQRRGGDQVVLRFFGDGASNQGVFHLIAEYGGPLEASPSSTCVENNL